MSLTRELRHKDSPVGRFLRETFPHTRGPLAECRAALRAPLVSRLSEDASPAAYGQIGRAIDYRIRYHFAITPWLEMAAPRALGFVVRSEDARAGAQGAVGSPIAEDSKLTGACITGFFAALDQTIADIAPHRRIPNEAEELTLARFCLILSAFESVHRFRHPSVWPPPYFGDTPPGTAAEFLELVPDGWVEDAAALGAAFVKRYPSWHGAGAVLNPSFAGSTDVGGADADLIADGCVWEIKTTTQPGAKGIWLHQLLGYVLLDYWGEYKVDSVGLVLPRQDTNISWPVDRLMAEMSGRGDLDLPGLRERFRDACESARSVREERRRPWVGAVRQASSE